MLLLPPPPPEERLSKPIPIYRSTALSASCPLLCLLHVASFRTQYAAKHWHSGTACTACCRLLWAVLHPSLCAVMLCLYLRAVLACFLFWVMLVLPVSREGISRKVCCSVGHRYVPRHTISYACDISSQESPETISHSISST